MWSSVVLLECDVVVLSLDKQNNISLSNLTPVAYSMLMCYRGQLFHPIFHLLSSSGMKWNDRYVICKISQLCQEQYPQAVSGSDVKHA
jgi:hypothetical protein